MIECLDDESLEKCKQNKRKMLCDECVKIPEEIYCRLKTNVYMPMLKRKQNEKFKFLVERQIKPEPFLQIYALQMYSLILNG